MSHHLDSDNLQNLAININSFKQDYTQYLNIKLAFVPYRQHLCNLSSTNHWIDYFFNWVSQNQNQSLFTGQSQRTQTKQWTNQNANYMYLTQNVGQWVQVCQLVWIASNNQTKKIMYQKYKTDALNKYLRYAGRTESPTNKEVLEMAKMGNVSKYIRNRRWKFIGCIMGKGYDNDCRTAMTWAPEGHRGGVDLGQHGEEQQKRREKKLDRLELDWGVHCDGRQSWLATKCQGLMHHLAWSSYVKERDRIRKLSGRSLRARHRANWAPVNET